MPDQPDVPHENVGTRQPSHRIATDFQLNEKFVETVGESKAQAMTDLLNRIGIEHGDDTVGDIAARIRDGLGGIGVQLSDVEVENFADQIARSHRVVTEQDLNPNEAGAERR